MKEKFFKFCEKFITGSYRIKINENKVLPLPKVALIFTLAFLLTAYGETKKIDYLVYSGYFLTVIGVFGFFYYIIFPNRRPKLEDILKNNLKK